MRSTARWGAVLWVLVAQYFVLLVVVESRWSTPYSWVRNAISDLGAATCFHSEQVDAWVCSPWSSVAGASWALAGLCLTGGALLARPLFPDTPAARAGLLLYSASGIGLVAVGLSPEDISPVPHFIGAVIAIVGGEVAMLLTGLALLREDRWTGFGRIGVAGAVVAVLGFVLMVAGVGGPGLFGLWERIAAFPVLLWAIACGVALLVRRSRAGVA
ncbi:putative membrane protein [Crossiella equi]|uniref:Membrane protein n=1 Tax=Crossiella equi TaxID=130796 RepID=A0ABS5A4C3_9PSEU|nr:DUF998 domain-containing protein [Crossiella equi]MBP2471421.1 putative membrane protein [Crossiella equi]